MSLKSSLLSNYGSQLLRNASCRGFRTSSLKNVGPRAVADEEEFRTLELKLKKKGPEMSKRMEVKPILPPRFKRMKIDQDWGNVWPTARTFHPSTVPFPIRQGYPAKSQAPPDKWGNAELMKIPNFLHLTPPVIERQCEALKKFCTPWPAGLETPEKQEKHFPVTVSKSSYLHSSPTVRDPRSRIVTYKVSLKSLNLDEHGRDKMLRLVGDRYDPASDCLTLVADRCPLSQQNYDYCRYLLTVLYSESMKMEPWEHEKEVIDRERYIWEGSPSQASVKLVLDAKEDLTPEEVLQEYEQVVTDLHNNGEDTTTVSRYREAVLKVIGIV